VFYLRSEAVHENTMMADVDNSDIKQSNYGIACFFRGKEMGTAQSWVKKQPTIHPNQKATKT